eukprot:gene30974-40302_t
MKNSTTTTTTILDSHNEYGAAVFQQVLEKYSTKVQTILRNEKTLTAARQHNLDSPANVPHSYNDKFTIAEQLTNCIGAVSCNIFAEFGITPPILEQLVSAAQNSSILLRLEAAHHCKFIKESVRNEDGPSKIETEVSNGANTRKVTAKVVTKISEYFYSYLVEYRLIAIIGTNTETPILIRSRSASQELVTRLNQLPFPSIETFKEDVDLTHLFSIVGHINDDGSFNLKFSINRSESECYTPVRNPQVAKALVLFHELHGWCERASEYFTTTAATQSSSHTDSRKNKFIAKMDEISKAVSEVFIPLIPLLHSSSPSSDGKEEEEQEGEGLLARLAGECDGAEGSDDCLQRRARLQHADPAARSACLSSADLSQLLNEQQRGLTQQLQALRGTFPALHDPSNNLLSVAEAQVMALCLYMKASIESYLGQVNAIEALVRDQLVAALGREVTPTDFQLYMSFHNRRLFRPEYRPVPFSYAVRRSPLHSPEGSVRLEMLADDARSFPSPSPSASPSPFPSPGNGGYQPIETFCRSEAFGEAGSGSGCRPEMSMAISATTRVRFRGTAHLHGWLAQSFSDSPPSAKVRIVATARQFSSFIVLLGSISSATTFEPKFACLLQNKDELAIPLALHSIPNAQQFRDAIGSLSPEQQRFAAAYRAMQLESSLLGVLLLQVKPQLETVLRLRPACLVKEIALTQDIMKLFIDFQIPADLLSYHHNHNHSDSDPDPASAVRIAAVKQHVQKILAIVRAAQDAELEERSKLREFAAGRPPRDGSIRVFPASTSPAATATATGTGQQAAKDRASLRDAAPADAAGPGAVDFSQLPALLDRAFDQWDSDRAVRPTIIQPADVWQRARPKALLLTKEKPAAALLSSEDLNRERHAAFDLLDALTCSGALPIHDAALHVIVAATHNFGSTVMNSIVQRNRNPIEAVERSSLIMVRTLFGYGAGAGALSASALVQPAHLSRLRDTAAALMAVQEEGAGGQEH